MFVIDYFQNKWTAFVFYTFPKRKLLDGDKQHQSTVKNNSKPLRNGCFQVGNAAFFKIVLLYLFPAIFKSVVSSANEMH